MPDITPIEWEDKVNSPELLAFLQQFGKKHYLTAEEINELRDKINLLAQNKPDLSGKLDRGSFTGTADDFLTKNTDQTVSGIKTFLAGKLAMRNIANTFNSFFSNSNTASRTYYLQNRSGTLLDDTNLSDINSNLATKQTVFSGIANYIPKSISQTILGVSRLFDNGTSFGIGTINIPLKDITLAANSSKDIGIEDSDSISPGKDLTLSGGRTVNYLISFLLQSINVYPGNNSIWFGLFSDNNNNIYATGFDVPLKKQTNSTGDFITVSGTPGGINTTGCVAPNGDIYLCYFNGGIYKQTGGSGTWVNTGAPNLPWISMCAMPNGDIYASGGTIAALGGYATDIYKQNGGLGTFNPMGFTARSYCICSTAGGDFYASVRGGSIYKMFSGTTVLVDLIQTYRNWASIAAAPNGVDIYAAAFQGDVYKQTGGTGDFLATGQAFREYFGLTISKSFNMYASTPGYNVPLFSVNINALGVPDLDGGNLKLKTGTGKGTGKNRILMITGQKTISGTDMQVEVLRAEYDENGNYKRYGTPVFDNNAAALSGGLTAGMEYRTSSGVKMEVY